LQDVLLELAESPSLQKSDYDISNLESLTFKIRPMCGELGERRKERTGRGLVDGKDGYEEIGRSQRMRELYPNGGCLLTSEDKLADAVKSR
jgi:hypothetical protein